MRLTELFRLETAITTLQESAEKSADQAKQLTRRLNESRGIVSAGSRTLPKAQDDHTSNRSHSRSNR